MRQGTRKGVRWPQEASKPLPPGPPPAENTTSSAAAGVALTWKANSNSVAWPPFQVPAAPSEDTGGGSAPRTAAPARQRASLSQRRTYLLSDATFGTPCCSMEWCGLLSDSLPTLYIQLPLLEGL